jgi:transcription antitermination factor NusG
MVNNTSGLRWYAVYTKPFWERKVSFLMDRSEIKNFCPLQKVQRQWSDRKKVIYTPLFRSYVFVHITDKEQAAVRQVSGVINFVNFLGKPAVIREAEIDTVKQFHNDYQNIEVKKVEFTIHDHVKIVGGPFVNMEGNVLNVRNKTVEVYLPSFGYILSASIDRKHLIKDIASDEQNLKKVISSP